MSMVRTSRGLAIGSWALYDFANTIFYAIVVTVYMPRYAESMGGGLTPYALATPPAMILAALLAPALGEVADRSGRARVWVVGWTILCASLTALLALPASVGPLLVTYSLALFAYNCAIVFYNSMLPSVARDGEMAKVSGLGVGLGYLGAVVAIVAARAVVGEPTGDPPRVDPRPAFVLAGALFLLFALPLWRFCPDVAPRRKDPGANRTLTGGARLRESFGFLRRAAQDRGLRLFFLGNFLCADALNAAYQVMVPYIESAHGLAMDNFVPMIAINVLALPAAVVMGVIGDRTSPKPVMVAGAVSLLLAMALPQALIEGARAGALGDAWTDSSDGPARWQVLAAGCLVVFGAIGVGGVLGAARKWICRLTPPEEHGAWFGVYGFTNKLSLIGLVVFARLHDWLGGYRWSVAFVAIELLVAVALLARAPRRREALA